MKTKNTSSYRLKKDIVEALLELMENESFSNITINKIVNKAQVNRSTYYRHFSSKENIIEFYFEDIVSDLIILNSNVSQDISSYLLKIVTHFNKYKKQLLLIYESDLTYLMLNVFNDFFNEVYKQETLEDEYYNFYHTGGVYNCFILWFSHEMRETPVEITKIISDFLPKDFKPLLISK